MRFDTRRLNTDADVIAPDGSEVRILCQVAGGSMAQFSLPPGVVSKAMAHRTIEEIWCFLSGHGRMWRKHDDHAEIIEVGPGISITIPVGTHFQFRSDGAEPLVALGVTMPPWPGEDEAYPVEGPWEATV